MLATQRKPHSTPTVLLTQWDYLNHTTTKQSSHIYLSRLCKKCNSYHKANYTNPGLYNYKYTYKIQYPYPQQNPVSCSPTSGGLTSNSHTGWMKQKMRHQNRLTNASFIAEHFLIILLLASITSCSLYAVGLFHKHFSALREPCCPHALRKH